MSFKITVQTLRLSAIALAISQLCVIPSWATETEAARIAELEKKLEKSVEQNEKLSARLGEIEKKLQALSDKAAPPTAAQSDPSSATKAAAQEIRIESLERNLTQMSEAANQVPLSQGLALHGFEDVGFAHSGKSVADNRKQGFVLGNVDFYLTPEFGDRVKSLIELNFEYSQDTGVLSTDLERMQIGYTLSDNLTLWTGRFHTPYGYWNTAFHHGAQIQTSIDRPRMIAFEDQGGIFPSHTVGLWATGRLPLGDGKLDYDAYIGNGDRILNGTLDFNAVKDDNGNMIVGGNIRYRLGGALDGLMLGADGFSEQVNTYTGLVLNNGAKVNMLGAYLFFDANGWENIAEYYHFQDTNQGVGGTSYGSWTGFAQVGYTFGGNTTPYARVEKASLSQFDNYFYSQINGRSYARQVLGVRYDLNPKSALKIEVNHTDETKDGGEKYNEAKAQFAVRF